MTNDATSLLLEGLNENRASIEARKMTRKGGVIMGNNTNSKAAVIGVGAGGSNVAHLLTQYGYDTAALNTAAADLTGIDVGITLTLKGLNGSGRDRAFAATEFKKSYKSFFTCDGIAKLIDNNNLIFVIATAGGGTGTILGIMVAGYLKSEYPNKNVVIVGILGSLKEDRISQGNMREFLSDIEIKTPDCPYMLFDNNRVTDRVGDGVYDSVNREIVDAIRFISKEYMVENTRSNIDGRDYARLMSYGGLMGVTLINDLNISVAETNLDLKARIKAAVGKSTAIVTKYPESYGIYMNVSTELYNSVDTTFEDIQDIYGKPAAGLIFKHLQNASNDGPQFGLIMTGLESPIERFSTIEKRIKEYSDIKEKAHIPEVDRVEVSVKLAGDTSKSDAGRGQDFMGNF